MIWPGRRNARTVEAAQFRSDIGGLMVRHGVTSYCPTTVTAPLDQTLKSLDDLARAAERADREVGTDPIRAQPLGIHLEGPFLSHARRGVHSGIDLQPVSGEAFNQ